MSEVIKVTNMVDSDEDTPAKEEEEDHALEEEEEESIACGPCRVLV